jgi:hypothetical protein
MERHPNVLEIPRTEVGLDQQVQDAKTKIALMETMGVNNAEFQNRNHFFHNRKTGVSVLAADGLIVERKGHLTTVVKSEPGSEAREVVKQVRAAGHSQNVAGAMVSRSQSWVSKFEHRCAPK